MRRHWPLVGGLLLLTASLFGMALSSGPGLGNGWRGMHGPMMGWWDNATLAPPVENASPVTVEATEFVFFPDEIAITSGQSLNLTMVNRGATLHNLTIPELGVQMVARPGESVTTGIRLPASGDYRFLCTVPGHAEQGMVGSLVVEP